MSNPFEDLKESATRHTQKKMARAAARQPMVPTPAEKAQRERSELLAQYKQWKSQIKRGMSAGLYSVEVLMLFRWLRRFPSPDQLLEWVKGSKWLLEASHDTRKEVMHWLSTAMMRWNIRHGLPPIDDGVPPMDGSEETSPSAYIRIRVLLLGENR